MKHKITIEEFKDFSPEILLASSSIGRKRLKAFINISTEKFNCDTNVIFEVRKGIDVRYYGTNFVNAMLTYNNI